MRASSNSLSARGAARGASCSLSYAEGQRSHSLFTEHFTGCLFLGDEFEVMRPSTPVPFGHYKTHKTHKTPPPSNGFGSCVDQSSISLDRSATSSKAWGGATNPNSIRFNPTTQPRTPQSMKFFNEISDWKGSFQTKWWKDLCTFNNKKDCQPSIDSKNMWLIIIFTCRIQRKQNWTYLQKTRFVYTKKSYVFSNTTFNKKTHTVRIELFIIIIE